MLWVPGKSLVFAAVVICKAYVIAQVRAVAGAWVSVYSRIHQHEMLTTRLGQEWTPAPDAERVPNSRDMCGRLHAMTPWAAANVVGNHDPGQP